jgi:hypothetical protein
MVTAGGTPGRIIPAVEVIRRLIDEPFTEKEIVLFVELVVFVNLQQRARNRKTITALCEIAQRAGILL